MDIPTFYCFDEVNTVQRFTSAPGISLGTPVGGCRDTTGRKEVKKDKNGEISVSDIKTATTLATWGTYVHKQLSSKQCLVLQG